MKQQNVVSEVAKGVESQMYFFHYDCYMVIVITLIIMKTVKNKLMK